jgi:hypothetical protein
MRMLLRADDPTTDARRQTSVHQTRKLAKSTFVIIISGQRSENLHRSGKHVSFQAVHHCRPPFGWLPCASASLSGIAQSSRGHRGICADHSGYRSSKLRFRTMRHTCRINAQSHLPDPTFHQNAIDQDERTMELTLAALTDDAFALAQRIYSNGGNSGSYAKLTLTAPITTTPLPKAGDLVAGVNSAGAAVSGKVLEAYIAGSTSISVAYDVSEVQVTHSSCRVGGLNVTLTTGCKLLCMLLDPGQLAQCCIVALTTLVLLNVVSATLL